ncbi:hypothetical protein B0O80DRAFT_450354 [Mortierella sp. GBAus27b]|nr:hypothetical protein B0O80DRAFT_450354 [Mortierella sp. GBAus27b]
MSPSKSPSEPLSTFGQTTPESPDQQRQESSGDTSDTAPATPKFERNADGKFRCTWPRCGKEFAAESRLSTHYRIHSGKPPYPCGYPGCTKAFHTSSSLSHHRVVHTDQGLRPYVCRHNRCGATYTQLARLITHQRNTHSGMILFIPQDASSSTLPGPSSQLVSDDTHTAAPTTEPRALPASVDSLQPPDRSSGTPPNSRNRPRPSLATEPTRRDSGMDESDDMEQRREAAMTMASLRERGSYSSFNTGSHASTRLPPSHPHPYSYPHSHPQAQAQMQQYSQPFQTSQDQNYSHQRTPVSLPGRQWLQQPGTKTDHLQIHRYSADVQR